MSQHHEQPGKGGSFIRQPDGSLKPNAPNEAAQETAAPAAEEKTGRHAAKKGR